MAALAAAVREFGPVYGLVNNAALANGVGGKEFQDIDIEVWDRLMAVNARSPWLVSKALYPLFATPARIVNIASDAALYGSPASPTTSPPRARSSHSPVPWHANSATRGSP